MPEFPLTGGCQCGGVRFEVSEPLVSAGYCHCSRCRRRTGTAASISAFVAPGSVRVTRGEELLRAWTRGDEYDRMFCGTCGSPLWTQRAENREVLVVRLGLFDGDPGIRPSYRAYVAYAAPWEPIPDDGLPRFLEARKS